MNSPSTRIRKRRAPQSPNLPVPLRRSARLQSKRRSTSILQGRLKHRTTAPQTSEQRSTWIPRSISKHRLTAPHTTHTRLPISNPVNAPVSSRVQLQGQLRAHQILKRRLDRSIENSSERPSKRLRLTKKNLEKLENMGKPTQQSRKPKSTGSRRKSLGLETKLTQSKQTTSATSEASSKTVSSTDSRFPALILRNGIVEPPNSRRPATFDLFQERLNRARETASPTESEYQLAAYKIETAENEQTVLLETSALLKGHERGYRRAYNQPFSDFPKNVGINNGASAAQPDMFEGLDLTQFDSFPIREGLGGAAVPSSGPNAITLPHLAGEWKGPGKDMILAQHQAAYDGACMVYGREQARSILGSPDPNLHAYVHTFTTDGTILNTFAHYSTQSRGQAKLYQQYPTSTSLLRSSHKDFCTVRRRLRNLQDIAKENSEALRAELMDKRSASQQYIRDEDDDGEEEEEEEDDNNDDGYILPPMSQGIQTNTADLKYCDSYDQKDEEDGLSSQLLTEYHASLAAKGEDEEEEGENRLNSQLLTEYHVSLTKDGEDEDESFVQIPTPDASSAASKPQKEHKKKKRPRRGL